MPWFRWLKKATTEDAAIDAAAPHHTVPAEAPPETETETETVEAAEGAADTEKPKRRRGSRGGRGRKKPAGSTAETTAATAATAAGQAAARAKDTAKPAGKAAKNGGERKDDKRRRSGSGQRRKQPPRRAPLPAAKRELVISVDVGEQRVAILEDDKVAEVYLERPERRSIAGNIYLGVVDNVLPGMEAAFVEIGLEKNGFLYVDEIVVPELEGKRHGKKIQDLISRGEKILVQAVKDPMKTKGARLTTEISLPGRFLVFVPNGEGLGVSRRLEEAERQRLKDILKPIAPAEGGVIVRTAAEGASADDIERDLVFLQRLWKTIETRAKKATAPELVYQEAELPLRIVRDLFAGDFVAAYVDNDRVHKRIVGYLKKTSPHMIERVERWKEKEPLFERFGVEQEIGSTLARRVDLPSGGYLIFDYAEAFTVIDVNTGRFVGSRSKSSTQRLEDTIVKNNLEAVKEVVRQLRLRDIGGIIVIDFIDMANAKNRQAVEDALRTELERDRTKTYVVEISPLGLVEMTRQNVTEGPREVMTRRCPTCHGDGIVVSDQTLAMEVERRLRVLAVAGAGSRVQAYRVAVHPRTLALLAGPGGSRLAALEESTRRRFFLVEATGHVHGDHLEVLEEGRLDDLRPESPAEEGARVDVKLVEVGLHDPTAGVAKLDGLDVVVADAAKLVGKKEAVLIGRALDGQAFATLADGAAAETPITFESEAEKPTRAPARRKQAETAPDVEQTSAAEEPASAEPEPEPQPEPEAPASKPAARAATAADEDVTEDETAEAVGDGEAQDEAQDDERPKKRTRRGSRGGKRRKKKPAEGAGEPGAEVDGAAAPATAADAGADTDVAEDASGPSEAPRKPRAKRAPKIHVPSADGGSAAPEGGDGPAPAPDGAGATAAEPLGAAGEATGGDGAGGDADAGDAGDESQPARKRTRRGSRGGRGRKKKTAPAGEPTGTEEGLQPVEGDAVGTAEGDDGHGAESDVGDVPKPATARRRSGTRRPPSTGATGAPAEPPATAGDGAEGTSDGAPSVEPSTEGGYVPMSEWLDDFEQPRGRR